MGYIISFSGIDGCGKSTLATSVATEINRKFGSNCTHYWLRVGYTPLMLRSKAGVRRLLRGKVPPPGRSAERSNLLMKPFVKNVWIFCALAELLFIIALRVRLSSLYSVVILDRTVSDSLIDLDLLFGRSWRKNIVLWTMALLVVRMLPRSFSFLIDIPLSVSSARCLQKWEPYPDTDGERATRYSRYSNEEFKKSFFMTIDGQAQIDRNVSLIIESVFT